MICDIDYLPFNFSNTLVLALSGGADSTFLLESLFEQGFKNVIVAHFDHNLRGKESDHDYEFCKCKALEKGYIFEGKKWENPKKDENSCRRARYEFLEKIREKYNAKAILTGHHQDDQAETIFLQWIRGGGMRALSGMDKWDRGRSIFRPLLGVKKSDIIDFLNKKSIEFVDESSNQDDRYTRNFLRLNIFPLLVDRFLDFDTRIVHQSSLFRRELDFLTMEKEEWIKINVEDPAMKGIDKKYFLSIRPFLQYEVIREILKTSLSSSQFTYIMNFIQQGESGKKYEQKMFCITLSKDRFFIDISE